MKLKTSAEKLKTKRLLIFLPLLMLPFLTMTFWALGGGKTDKASVSEYKEGFNTAIPSAKFDDAEKEDKFSAYEALENQLRNQESSENPFANIKIREYGSENPEDEIYEKLAELNNSFTKSDPRYYSENTYAPIVVHDKPLNRDVRRLEGMMNMMSNDGEDEEMQQLDGILEKIMDIQYPGRAKEKKERRRDAGTYVVRKANDSFEEGYSEGNAFKAVIHQNQEIVTGAVIKLRLLDSISVNDLLIPQNHFIYGIAEINNERLQINLKTLRYKNSIIPVSLSAFDLDGLEGLFIPGTISRDASKAGANDAIQSLQFMTMDPSVSAQAAGAGVQAMKGLFSKKVKQVRVKLKAGYQLLLRDNNHKNL